ncbi:PAS domain-containing protein [Persicimonas caeni]|uniref:PAS domain-containing protein n=1 Tax=Persicimonas caeni TaxID=2292766 RepID=A0A4Y6Q131_PERCE|nr:PAS domain-containing protein [Persicimonas caeni]QDG53937.1 PAS domain-containing protein [Persicimonas caeni]QED35158.1 PAS domain-containing protein [Persicimonas caeni]
MSVFPNRDNIEEYLDSLEQQVADLQEENELLEKENQLLRKRLQRAQASRGGGAAGSASRSRGRSDDSDSPSTLPGVKMHELRDAAAKAGIRTKDNDWRAPNLNQASAVEHHHGRRDELRSATLGRPLQPSEFDSPEPSRPSGGAPPVDLGYVNRVGADELDDLPYGLVVLDREGNVLFYNETESRYAGYKPEHVVGKNFFQDVAPCTRVKEFEGRFRQFVDGELGRVTFFDFAFHFESGTQDVTIALSQGRYKGQVNVMMMRR